MAAAEDVVVFEMIHDPDGVYRESVGRDTLAVAQAFIANPTWPYKQGQSFIAVDEWGYGNIVAATEDFQTMIGRPANTFPTARPQ